MTRGESSVSGAALDRVVFWLLVVIAVGGILLIVLYSLNVLSI